MKTIVVLHVFIFAVFAKVPYELMDDWNALAAVYADECILESGADPEIAKQMFENHKLVNEEHIRCYFKCLMIRYKFMSKDGVFNAERLIQGVQHVPYELMDDWNALAAVYADECILESGADAEIAKQMFENHKLVNEEHIRCYFKCLMIRYKFMSKDGVFNAERLIQGVQHVPYELMDDWNALAAVYADECILESGADAEIAKQMFENHKLVNEEHIRCYFKCLMIRYKFMSKDGVFNAERLIQGVQHVPYELMDDWNALAAVYADECILESGADAEIAKQMFENHKLVNEEHIRCYFKCLMIRYKFMSKDGVFNAERLIQGVQHVPYELMDDWNALAAVYADECILESGADAEIAKQMFENHKLVNEEHIRCYFKCLMIRYKFMSKDGVFNAERLIQGVQHVTPEIAETCITKHGDKMDLCKKSYLVASCVAEENYETM
ncbi:hypothetical protein RN001_007552 [Aquatica leii]|uniref:Uncharacterized protein n=1 Tax=Aquatica leii TaxID=1421715 RepID=A0AAN7S959_9COLE|nr:hypothetical protein RN001_007552 [Aquatica leii]